MKANVPQNRAPLTKGTFSLYIVNGEREKVTLRRQERGSPHDLRRCCFCKIYGCPVVLGSCTKQQFRTVPYPLHKHPKHPEREAMSTAVAEARRVLRFNHAISVVSELFGGHKEQIVTRQSCGRTSPEGSCESSIINGRTRRQIAYRLLQNYVPAATIYIGDADGEEFRDRLETGGLD